MKGEGHMREAIGLARENVEKGLGGPFGAVVVRDGRVIGRGSNRVTTGNDPTAHAEVLAIREACQALGSWVLEGCEIYCSCEPCPMCLASIYWSRIGKVYYAAERTDAADAGFDDEWIYKELARPMADREVTCEQMARSEALEVMERWKADPKKVNY